MDLFRICSYCGKKFCRRRVSTRDMTGYLTQKYFFCINEHHLKFRKLHGIKSTTRLNIVSVEAYGQVTNGRFE